MKNLKKVIQSVSAILLVSAPLIATFPALAQGSVWEPPPEMNPLAGKPPSTEEEIDELNRQWEAKTEEWKTSDYEREFDIESSEYQDSERWFEEEYPKIHKKIEVWKETIEVVGNETRGSAEDEGESGEKEDSDTPNEE